MRDVNSISTENAMALNRYNLGLSDKVYAIKDNVAPINHQPYHFSLQF